MSIEELGSIVVEQNRERKEERELMRAVQGRSDISPGEYVHASQLSVAWKIYSHLKKTRPNVLSLLWEEVLDSEKD